MSRPRPPVSLDASFFWEGVGKGELRVQQCARCGALQHPPRPACPVCHSLELDYVVTCGDGTIYTYAVHHHPPVPGFEMPFVSVVVALEEGPRLLSNLIDHALSDVKIGTRVRVVFREVEPGLTLPLFAPNRTDEEGKGSRA